MGKIMRKKTWWCVQPSIRPDSSISVGNASKNEIIIQIIKGSPTSIWLKISAVYVSTKWILENKMNQGIRKVIPGIILATKMRSPSFWR
ncbi:hypothetical protein D3C85_1672350 [compost metagenome]